MQGIIVDIKFVNFSTTFKTVYINVSACGGTLIVIKKYA